MILNAEVTSWGGSDILGNLDFSQVIRTDLNGFNPLVRYGLNCADCSGGYWANSANIRMTLTDGVDVTSYTITVAHESESGNSYPYCWSFEYDPQLNFP